MVDPGDLRRRRMRWSAVWLSAIANIGMFLVGIGTLVLAVVTFWNTTQITGVNDYFRSQVTDALNDEADARVATDQAVARLEQINAEFANVTTEVEALRRTESALVQQNNRLQRAERDLGTRLDRFQTDRVLDIFATAIRSSAVIPDGFVGRFSTVERAESAIAAASIVRADTPDELAILFPEVRELYEWTLDNCRFPSVEFDVTPAPARPTLVELFDATSTPRPEGSRDEQRVWFERRNEAVADFTRRTAEHDLHVDVSRRNAGMADVWAASVAACSRRYYDE